MQLQKSSDKIVNDVRPWGEQHFVSNLFREIHKSDEKNLKKTWILQKKKSYREKNY